MPYGITQCYLPPDRGDIPALYPSRSWYSIKRPRRDARLSWPSWLVTYRDGIPARRRSPIAARRALTSFMPNAANHYATPPTYLVTYLLTFLHFMFYVGLLIVRLCFMSDIVLFIDWLYSIDLFSCIAANLFNKLTYLLTCHMKYLWNC